MTRGFAWGAALLLLAGCGQPGADNTAVGNVAAPAPLPSPSATATLDLSRHAGRYPSDKVDGVTFLAQPAVRAAVLASGADRTATDFVFASDGPQNPIALRDGRLSAWGCEAHNCDAHDWSVRIAQDGSAAEVCYHDADSGEPPRWFANGKPEARRESCG